MVCSMTRGPAKPMSAPGSPRLRSPSMAKLAVTPAVGGVWPSIRGGGAEEGVGMEGGGCLRGGSVPGVAFSPAHRPRETADEAKFHGAKDDGPATELAFGGDHRVIHAEFFLGFSQARGVGLGVDEFEGVGGGHARVVFGPAAV